MFFRVYAPKCHACGQAITPVEVNIHLLTLQRNRDFSRRRKTFRIILLLVKCGKIPFVAVKFIFEICIMGKKENAPPILGEKVKRILVKKSHHTLSYFEFCNFILVYIILNNFA